MRCCIAGLYHHDAEMLSVEFGAKQGRDAIRDPYATWHLSNVVRGEVEADAVKQ